MMLLKKVSALIYTRSSENVQQEGHIIFYHKSSQMSYLDLSDSFEHLCYGSTAIRTTVDLVIFACLNFREFLILGLFTKFRIREFSFLVALI